jgi:hypothetical protein
VDVTAVLESIARLFPSLPEQAIENQLVTFDALVAVAGKGQRTAAAQLLREVAASCLDSARNERLLRAANAVAAGQPCALTPDGLSAKQAAAVQTVTADEWEERLVRQPLPLPPGDSELASEDDEEDAEPDYMEEQPPQLPHLPVCHFFPGLLVRVGRNFADAQGRALCSGDLLRLLSCELTDAGGYILNLPVRTVRLSAGACHEAIIENAANAWFQPAPSIECLQELCEAINSALSTAGEDQEMDEDDSDRIETLRDEIEVCEEWLLRPGERGPAPQGRSAPLAARIFGRDHNLTAWIRLLFAGIAVALPDHDRRLWTH